MLHFVTCGTKKRFKIGKHIFKQRYYFSKIINH